MPANSYYTNAKQDAIDTMDAADLEAIEQGFYDLGQVVDLKAPLNSPVLTTPQINDTSSDHQYVLAVNELLADRTITLPLLTGADEFLFKDHAVTITNKTIALASNTITGTKAEFDTACSDDNFIYDSEIGSVVQAWSAVLDATTASFTTADETKLDYITITGSVNLDTINSRVNALDAAVILVGSFAPSGGSFPGSGTAQAGESWIASDAGTIDSVTFASGDRIVALTDNASTTIYASNWLKLDYTDQVSSVAGKTGAVTLAIADITDFNANVETWLATPSSANLATAVTDETGSGSLVFATGPALSGPTINDGYTEEVFAVTGTTPAIAPGNGSVQTWSLSGSSTPTAGTWANGQKVVLHITAGANTISWASMSITWKTDNGSDPTLKTSGVTTVVLDKVGGVLYGYRAGDGG